ncbi:maltose alpha-D-glucosyltransferase [Fimbriiglobus ruber]|uniref:maltose alpha-D-glucosyltransferase n=1 Tax=Fimbriiglobus ruber TaxID=1908690 RepID=A0A225DF96_9BACT|nr:maltose alpha-D-glucosyltransferase [Fimbriiglobus ruber]OWK34767.1 Trehalose synthase [Fimbriiglobus ruber]
MSSDALWYKDAIIYEVHVRAFHDGDGDGVGDFDGLTKKLDYLEDLGVTAIWLLPFYPSPLKDDGYDIADYTTVNPQYGSLDEFKTFLAEAHRRGIRVITELVINHTSDQHPWFQRARRAPLGHPDRDFYVWSDTPDKYPGVPIIFPGFETSNWTWDPVAKQYVWHRFYSHQPDLNYDNPAVWDAIFPVVDFWFGLGVDGMRLDAVPYLYERDGTACENLPETHAFLKALRKHVDDRFPDKMFLAEANVWPEEAVDYFGTGDECQMAFHFPLMPRLFMALQQEDRFPIVDVFAQTPAIPDTCQWCLFLRNHDEMTLAMVTDEERDYMYRAYAQERQARIFLGIRHRLAPLVRSDRRRIELLNALLFSLPGTPVVYYGDEIGMGDNIYLGDRNGVRTPMQWSADRNAGFSRANPQKLYLPINIDPEFHYEAVNVEAQQNNPSSLLWWMKRLIAQRKRFTAFGRGTTDFVSANNSKVLAFVRKFESECVLVVANLSRFVQHAAIDLRDFRGIVPEEVFGRSLFPAVGDAPYPLTLGPHGFFWFSLSAATRAPGGPAAVEPAAALPTLRVADDWTELVEGPGRDDLERVLPDVLNGRRAGHVRGEITGCRILSTLSTGIAGLKVRMVTVRIEYQSRLPEIISIPMTFVPEDRAETMLAPLARVGIARVRGPHPGVICEPIALPEYATALPHAVAAGQSFPTPNGFLVAVPLPGFENLAQAEPGEGPPVLVHGHYDNLTVTFGNRLVLKTYRRIEDGTNPDLEIGRYLADRQFTGIAPLVGYVEYRRRGGGEPITLAVLRGYIPHQGDAWQLVLDQLSRFFERVAALSKEQPPVPPPPAPLFGERPDPERRDATTEWQELVGPSLVTARLLGERTAALHAVLAADDTVPTRAPEPFTRTYRRSLYQSLRTLAAGVCGRLKQPGADWPDAVRAAAAGIDDQNLSHKVRDVLDPAITGSRIRCHGDYHLGRLMYTGKDFILVDFEGDASRTTGERRIKRSPLMDVASLIRSLDYAVGTALYGLSNGRGRTPGLVRPEDVATLTPWADAWRTRVAREFVNAYLAAIPPVLLPETVAARAKLLNTLMLERALHEVDYDLAVRPAWAMIPLAAVSRLMSADGVDGVCA